MDIKNFGAKGDGVTDDSLALQTAIDFAAEDRVCPDCNCDIDVHDFQHLACYCYPARVGTLKASLGLCRSLLDGKDKEIKRLKDENEQIVRKLAAIEKAAYDEMREILDGAERGGE